MGRRPSERIVHRYSIRDGTAGGYFLGNGKEMHHVRTAHLLAFFNPMIRSLRTFELASQSVHVQELVDISRICRSTHSDFLAVADSELLLPLIQVLRDKLPDLKIRDGDTICCMESYSDPRHNMPRVRGKIQRWFLFEGGGWRQ